MTQSNYQTEFFSKESILELLKQTNDLEFESFRIPKIHNELNVLLLEMGKRISSLSKKQKRMFKEKWLYYSGKASQEVYKEKPFSLKVLKTDLGIFLESDEELSELNHQLDHLKLEIKFIEECLKQLNQRNYQHRIIMDDRRFKSGG